MVGAGIVGLFTAYYLSQRGYEVEVIEREERIGEGISGSNAGVLHLIQQPFNSVKSILARLGARKYREVADIFGIDIYETDLRIVGFTYLDRLYLDIIALILSRNGFKVSRERSLSNIPEEMNKNIKYLLRVDGYGVVEPKNVLNRLAEYLARNGVDIKLSTWEYEEDIYDYIVLSAGPHTYMLGEMLGDEVPRHRYALGVMVNVDVYIDGIYAFPPNPLRKYTKGGAAIPREGYTLLGPGFKWVDSIDYRPREVDIKEVYNRFARLFSQPPRILSAAYGVRPINYPRDDFIIRRRGKYIFTYGIDSPGFTAAPMIGIIIANLVSAGEKYIEITRDNLEKYMVE